MSQRMDGLRLPPGRAAPLSVSTSHVGEDEVYARVPRALARELAVEDELATYGATARARTCVCVCARRVCAHTRVRTLGQEGACGPTVQHLVPVHERLIRPCRPDASVQRGQNAQPCVVALRPHRRLRRQVRREAAGERCEQRAVRLDDAHQSQPQRRHAGRRDILAGGRDEQSCVGHVVAPHMRERLRGLRLCMLALALSRECECARLRVRVCVRVLQLPSESSAASTKKMRWTG
jgi:hypothetical protein